MCVCVCVFEPKTLHGGMEEDRVIIARHLVAGGLVASVTVNADSVVRQAINVCLLTWLPGRIRTRVERTRRDDVDRVLTSHE